MPSSTPTISNGCADRVTFSFLFQIIFLVESREKTTRFVVKPPSTCLASFSYRNSCFDSQVFTKIKECIEGRVEADRLGGENSEAEHILDDTHTHIGIGMYVIDNRLRYVEASDIGTHSNAVTKNGPWTVDMSVTKMELLWYLRRLVNLW